MRRQLATGISALALAFGPLMCAGAPQASWLGCKASPANLVRLDTAPEAWPLGEVVVVEGFIGSLVQRGESSLLSVLVRSTTRFVFCEHEPPLALFKPLGTQCVIMLNVKRLHVSVRVREAPHGCRVSLTYFRRVRCCPAALGEV